MAQPAATPGTPENPSGLENARSQNPVAAHPITCIAIFVLLFGAICGTLIVPIYASTTPKVGDFPFFYFYMLIYMPVTAAAVYLAMLLQKRLVRRDSGREATS
jgi:hypothetical protein